MTARSVRDMALLAKSARRRSLAAVLALVPSSLVLATTVAFAAGLTVSSSGATTGQDIVAAYVTLTPATGVAPGGTVTVTGHNLRSGPTNVTISCSTTCTPSASHYSVSGGGFTTTATVTIPGSVAPGNYSVTASDSTVPAQAPTAQFAAT